MLIIAIVISILFFIITTTLIIGNYFCNIALNPKVSKKYIIRSVSNEDKKSEEEDKIEGKKWLKEFAEETDIISNDKLRLHGYKVLNPVKKSSIWIVLIHGYMGCSYEMVRYAKKFIDMGYNTLLIDLRAHGKSEGKYIGMGWKDKDDLICWINRLCNQYEDVKIILYGISMGAATVMMTSGEKLPSNIKCVIEDCGYSSIEDEYKSILININSWITKYILFSANIVTKIKIGYFFDEASSVNQIKKSKLPMLFIHGTNDTFVPYEMLDKIYEAKSNPKEKLIVEGAGHAKSAKIQPELYWNKVQGFIKRYIQE